MVQDPLGMRAGDVGETQRLPAGGTRWRSAIWLLATVILAIACAAALVELGKALVAVVRATGANPLATSAAIGIVALVLAAGAFLIWLVATRRPLVALAGSILMLVALRLVAVWGLDVPRHSDWTIYHQLALGWIQGAPPIADVPMGYPILLAEAYRLGGVSVASGELLNVVASVVSATLLAALIWSAAGPRAAAVAVAFLALTPSQVLFAPVLGTETVFCTVLVGIAFLEFHMITELRRDRRTHAIVFAVATGAALGLATYVRATSLALIPPVAVLPLIVGAHWRRAAPLMLAVVLAAGIALLPVVAWNRILLDRWSASTSLYLGWQLYLGTNVEEGGRYNAADVSRRNALLPSTPRIGRQYAAGVFDRAALQAVARRDALVTELAIERIRENAIRLPLLLPSKAYRGWATARWPAREALESLEHASVTIAVAGLAAQVAWFAALTAAVASYVRERQRLPVLGLVIAAIVIPIALGLLVLEVQPRYHEYVVPLLAGLFGLNAAVTGQGLHRRLSSEWRHGNGPRAPGRGSHQLTAIS